MPHGCSRTCTAMLLSSNVLWPGTSPATRRVLDKLSYVARSEVRVVLMGEPGVGKTSLARVLHDLSGRTGDLVVGELPALNDELALSQLCGHRRGSFTGADADASGWLDFARGGTLLLDEIQLASTRIQTILLGILGRNAYRRMGEPRERSVDTRFVFATNEDLTARSAAGTMRTDLLARIGSTEIRVPPLRERSEEILALATHFLARLARMRGRATEWEISPPLARLLLEAEWPGNVWDLWNTCQFLALSPDTTLLPRHLEDGFCARQLPAGMRRVAGAVARDDVARALEAHETKASAARALGITRQHLHRLERRFALVRTPSPELRGDVTCALG